MEELTYQTECDVGPVLVGSTSFKAVKTTFSSLSKETPLIDPFSDPSRPQTITLQDVKAAEDKIAPAIACTPCEKSRLSDTLHLEAYFKMDFLQCTGSFKERGARNALIMLTKDQKKAGVISASLGNHALAISYHGNDLGIPVTVVLPVVAPIMKIARCRTYNACVVVQGRNMKEAKMVARKLAESNGYTYIDCHDNLHVMAGQGTLGLEILSQVPEVEAVVLPVGSGGLIAGVAVAIKSQFPKIKIIGVESDRCPSFSTALQEKKPTLVSIKSTLAEGLAVPLAGANAFATAQPLIDKMIVVNEDWISLAMLRLVECEKCVVEGAGAATLAAVLSGQLDELAGKKVVLTISGGNVDTSVLGRCIERGLTAEGRLLKFKVAISDRPGTISELTRLIGSIGASIKDLAQERTWLKDDVFSVQVACVCETRDKEHSLELQELLSKTYKKLNFWSFESDADGVATASASDSISADSNPNEV